MPARKIKKPLILDQEEKPILDQEEKQPSRGRRAVLAGGAIGLAAVAGTTFGRSQPADASTTNVTQLMPSGDTTGATDAANIAAAFSALPSVADTDTGLSYTVGVVLLAPGDFYVNSAITKPPKVDLIGSGPGTVIFVVGNVTGIYAHHGATTGPEQHATKSGTIANLVVDGTNAGASSYGIDIGDGWGHRLDHVWVNNFTGASAIGLYVVNRQFYTSEFVARDVILVNNTTAVEHGLASTTGDNSQEYQDVEYNIWAEPNQNGIINQGVTWNGSMRVRGNFLKGTASGYAVLTLQVDTTSGNNAGMKGFFDISVEMDASGTNSVNPGTIVFGDSSQGPFVGVGYLRFTAGHANPAPGQLQFRGVVIDTSNTIQPITAPAFPASGPANAITNAQNDANVYITGGTITQIQINGLTTGITATTGQVVSVFLPAGGTISATYTGTPSWTWISAL